METDPTLVESARIHFCGRFDAADRLRLAKTAAGQRQLFHPDRSASVYINECVQRVRPAGKNLSVLPPIEHRQTPEPARGRAYVDGGAPGPIRTGDPLLRRQMLYPTELRARPYWIVALAEIFSTVSIKCLSVSLFLYMQSMIPL